MSERRVWAMVVAALIVAAVWLSSTTREPKSPVTSATTSKASASPSAIRERPASLGLAVPYDSHLADELNSNTGSIEADLKIVKELLEAFRAHFPPVGIPSGDNAAITAALTGKNRLKRAFISKSHRAINARNELCDRWGSPFSFHRLPDTHFEIRSAGPNCTLGDGDDVVINL